MIIDIYDTMAWSIAILLLSCMIWNALAFITQTSPITIYKTTLLSTTITKEESTVLPKQDSVNVVLITGFESFNRDLYEEAGRLLPPE